VEVEIAMEEGDLGTALRQMVEPAPSEPTAAPQPDPTTVEGAIAMVADDADWLHAPLDGGLFLSTPHARVLALKYPTVLTVTTEAKGSAMPFVHVAARGGFANELPAFTVALAFVPALTADAVTAALRALVDKVLFDGARTKVVVTPVSEELRAAVRAVFPEAAHHWCEESVVAFLKAAAGKVPRTEVTSYVEAWKRKVLHGKAEGLADALAELEEEYVRCS
jgi:hypothetical protein